MIFSYSFVGFIVKGKYVSLRPGVELLNDVLNIYCAISKTKNANNIIDKFKFLICYNVEYYWYK